MIAAKINVIALAIITGRLLSAMPYVSQSAVPMANSEYMDNDIPDVFLVWIVLTACGKKEAVVQNAAARPVIVIMFIRNFSTRYRNLQRHTCAMLVCSVC
jgi:hypothetical protein